MNHFISDLFGLTNLKADRYSGLPMRYAEIKNSMNYCKSLPLFHYLMEAVSAEKRSGDRHCSKNPFITLD